MVKNLIARATFLLIQDIPETIYYTCVILDFTLFTQYLLYDKTLLFYIDHVLYKFNKTKILFMNHYLIIAKLFQFSII